MEPLLWSFEEIRPFAGHRDAPLRRWALDRLIKLFPDRAGEVLLTMLDDKDAFIASEAVDFLGKSGDTDKYGPTLLEHLNRADGEHFGRLAVALARSDA